MRVPAVFVERSTGEILLAPPKSKAGRRMVGIPAAIIPALREDLSIFTKANPGALVFPGAKGRPLHHGNFNKMSAWPQAVMSVGAEGLHFRAASRRWPGSAASCHPVERFPRTTYSPSALPG